METGIQNKLLNINLAYAHPVRSGDSTDANLFISYNSCVLACYGLFLVLVLGDLAGMASMPLLRILNLLLVFAGTSFVINLVRSTRLRHTIGIAFAIFGLSVLLPVWYFVIRATIVY